MAKAKLQSYDLTQLNILVLEKHVLIRQLLTDVFRIFGVATVQSTSDPDKAFKMFQAFPSDVVLTDWTYDLDGLDFVERIRKDPDTPNPYVPIIVTIANTRIEHVKVARDIGMTEFLTKPISAKLLYSRIAAVVEDQRHYIRVGDFFGPDRRRRNGDEHIGIERRRASLF